MKSDPDYGKISKPTKELPENELDSIDWKSFLGCDNDATEDEVDKMFENQF